MVLLLQDEEALRITIVGSIPIRGLRFSFRN